MHPAAIARAAVERGPRRASWSATTTPPTTWPPSVRADAGGRHAWPCRAWRSRREEEVHLVALLPDAAAAGVLHARVAAALPGRNAPAAFGEQVIANEHGEVLGFNASLLAGATTWTVEPGGRTRSTAPAAWPSRRTSDRERFGMVGQLGFVPPGLRARRHRGVGGHRLTTPAGGGTRTRSGCRPSPARTRTSRARSAARVTFLHLDCAEHRRGSPRDPGRRRPGGARRPRAGGRPGAVTLAEVRAAVNGVALWCPDDSPAVSGVVAADLMSDVLVDARPGLRAGHRARATCRRSARRPSPTWQAWCSRAARPAGRRGGAGAEKNVPVFTSQRLALRGGGQALRGVRARAGDAGRAAAG